MGTKTVWVECRNGVDGEPFWFPGHNLQHATARAIQSFASIAIPEQELEIEEYVPRKKIVTPRKHKKLRAKHLIASQY